VADDDVVLAGAGVGDLKAFKAKVVNGESAEIYKHTSKGLQMEIWHLPDLCHQADPWTQGVAAIQNPHQLFSCPIEG